MMYACLIRVFSCANGPHPTGVKLLNVCATHPPALYLRFGGGEAGECRFEGRFGGTQICIYDNVYMTEYGYISVSVNQYVYLTYTSISI